MATGKATKEFTVVVDGVSFAVEIDGKKFANTWAIKINGEIVGAVTKVGTKQWKAWSHCKPTLYSNGRDRWKTVYKLVVEICKQQPTQTEVVR